MPMFVDHHPTAAIYMVTEKAAQMIIDKYRGNFTDRGLD
jgi:hypothetical protein